MMREYEPKTVEGNFCLGLELVTKKGESALSVVTNDADLHADNAIVTFVDGETDLFLITWKTEMGDVTLSGPRNDLLKIAKLLEEPIE